MLHKLTVFALSIRTYQLVTIRVLNLNKYNLCLKIAVRVANSVDPDETPHSALFAKACLSEYIR